MNAIFAGRDARALKTHEKTDYLQTIINPVSGGGILLSPECRI
jgi:hypothetical protein